MTPTRVKQHRKRKHTTEGHLVLVPFIDMMTILVVFLLLHTADVDILPNTNNIEIPQSISDVKPRETLVVMLTRDSLYVAGQRVASLAEVRASEQTVFEPLKTALLGQSDRVLGGSENAAPANREVTIMGDREIPYSILKKVMATCTSADFGKVSLAVIERERAVAPANAA
ncbi:MAG: biopolymer transporter ExbD [Gammaproteobacteria bacterium]|nr:biopolymer transporter ExbD [Gammaproteobacteria bacterium]